MRLIPVPLCEYCRNKGCVVCRKPEGSPIPRPFVDRRCPGSSEEYAVDADRTLTCGRCCMVWEVTETKVKDIAGRMARVPVHAIGSHDRATSDRDVCATCGEVGADPCIGELHYDKVRWDLLEVAAAADPGLHRKYFVERIDEKPLKGGQAIVLEVGDPKTWPALYELAISMEGAGQPTFAAHLRGLFPEENFRPGEIGDADQDLNVIPRVALVEKARAMRADIREHRSATGHKLCHHWPELWRHLPEQGDRPVVIPPRGEFLEKCAEFHANLTTGAPCSEWSYRTQIEGFYWVEPLDEQDAQRFFASRPQHVFMKGGRWHFGYLSDAIPLEGRRVLFVANSKPPEPGWKRGEQPNRAPQLRLFRPSNATEGDAFISQWCGNCQRDEWRTAGDDQRPACDIVGRTMGHKETDPEYPQEWIYDDKGPLCTAFLAKVPKS